MSISERALLVELNISTWTANKLDRNKTNEVLSNARAERTAGKFHKNLMTGTKLVKDVNDYAAKCRLWNNTTTLPWQDRGPRLMPTSLFLDYKEQINERKSEFWNLVYNLRDNYEAAKQTARIHLGSLYNEADYPHIDEIMHKFNWRFTVTSVPKAGHFMVDVPAEELIEMQESCEADVERRVKDAMQSAWDRLHKMCADMSKKLTALDEEEENKKRWHDSFVTNPLELCKLLSHLNVTNDPDLDAARRKLEATMQYADIEVLKDSPAMREALKKDVDSIIQEYEW